MADAKAYCHDGTNGLEHTVVDWGPVIRAGAVVTVDVVAHTLGADKPESNKD